MEEKLIIRKAGAGRNVKDNRYRILKPQTNDSTKCFTDLHRRILWVKPGSTLLLHQICTRRGKEESPGTSAILPDGCILHPHPVLNQ